MTDRVVPVISVRPKICDLHLNLFAQAIHPELFEVCARRVVEREQYSLELNITTDGHAIQFTGAGQVLTEVSAGVHHPLPNRSVLLRHPIAERAQHHLLAGGRVDYQTQVQIESVDPKLFVSVQQQLDARTECQGLIHRFGSNGRLNFGAISYIHVQSFIEKVLIRSFHTFPESNTVVTTESRFGIRQQQA